MARAGLVEVPINTAYKGSFLDHALRSTDVPVLVTDAALLELVADLPEVPHHLNTVVLVDGPARPHPRPRRGPMVSWNDLLAAGDPRRPPPRPPATRSRSCSPPARPGGARASSTRT